MKKYRLFPTLIFALFSMIIVHLATPAAASPAEEAVADWFANWKEAGATVARYDAVQYDAATDTVTIKNPQIDWTLVFAFEKSLKIELSFTTSRIMIVGFESKSDGFSAEQYIVPDAAHFKMRTEEANGDITNIVNTTEGIKLEQVYFPRLTPVPEDPQHPVSRYLHFYDLYLKIMIKKSVIGKVLVNQTFNNEAGFQATYSGLSMLGLQNGQIEETKVSSYKQNAQLLKSDGDVGFDSIETTYGEIIQRGIDIRPIVDALKGGGGGVISDYKTVLAESTMSDIELIIGTKKISIDSYQTKGLKLRPGKRSLLALFDRQALGEKVDDTEALEISFDFMRGFAIDEMSATNLKAAEPQKFSAKLGKIILKGLSNLGLKELSLEGVYATGSEGETLALGHMTIGEIVFPDVEEIMAAVEKDALKKPFEIAALGPKIGKIEIAGLNIDDKEKPTLSLGVFRLLQSEFIGAIPTKIKLDIEKLHLPLAYIPVPMAHDVFKDLGYDVLKLASKILLVWDGVSEDLTLENADIALENGFSIKLNAGLAGVPKEAIENPQEYMQALTTVAFRNVNFLIEDAVLVSRLIDYFAKTQNAPPAGFRSMIVQSLEMQVGPLVGADFMQKMKTALTTFLEKPDRLSVDLNPPSPVPFSKILEILSIAPEELPQKLGASVSAN